MEDILEFLLASHEGKRELSGLNYSLWVPPVTAICDLPPISDLRDYRYRDMTPRRLPSDIAYIIYPVFWLRPSAVMDYETPDEICEILRYVFIPREQATEGWKPAYWGPPVRSMTANDAKEWGWHQITDSTGSMDLLKDFLKLAVDTVTPKTSEQVKSFVQRWGPLWLCRAEDHVDCHWGPQWHPDLRHSSCHWAPAEEIWHFVRKAWEARAILEVAMAIRQRKPVPKNVWSYLACLRAHGSPKNPGWFQQFDQADYKRLIETTVNRYLAPRVAQGPRLLMAWDESIQPTLHVVGGMGFLYAVWFSIAQALCEARRLIQCSECGMFYERQGRRPQAGRRNFCPTCGISGAKRRWAREKRGKKSKNP